MKTVQRHPVVWPWILGLLIFAALIWGIVELAVARSSPEPQGREGAIGRAAIDEPGGREHLTERFTSIRI